MAHRRNVATLLKSWTGNRDSAMPIPARSVTPLFEVYDLPRSIAFYGDVLGCEVAERAGNGWAMLKLGDAEFMIHSR